MTVLPFRTSTYARNIVLVGSARLTARDGFTGIPAEYVTPVKTFAAKNYYIDDLDAALAKGWLLQSEYDDIMAIKTPSDPQYRPTALAATEPPA